MSAEWAWVKGFSLVPVIGDLGANRGLVSMSFSVSVSGFSQSFIHMAESFFSDRVTASLSPLVAKNVERAASLEVVELTSEEEPIASPEGTKRLRSESAWPIVLLGIVDSVSSETSMDSVPVTTSTPTFSSSGAALVGPLSPSVTDSTSERDPPAVVTFSCVVVACVKRLERGEVVARTRDKVDIAVVAVVGFITVMAVVEGTAAMVVAAGSVGGCCVVVVVVVVVAAARTVGGKGVSFLVGGGMVGVGGLNLKMEVERQGQQIRVKQKGKQ